MEFDDPGSKLVSPERLPTAYSRAQFVDQVGQTAVQGTAAASFVLADLPETFDRAALDSAMATLSQQHLTRGPSGQVIERLEAIAAAQYAVRFPADSVLGERVLMPGGPAESHGLEDLRLVRCSEADGSISYRGTSTAFDGPSVTATSPTSCAPAAPCGTGARSCCPTAAATPASGSHWSTSSPTSQTAVLATALTCPASTPGGSPPGYGRPAVPRRRFRAPSPTI